ncbi:ribosome hibernation-promoting factor, HPF/YfiA family [Scrofimicrobium sp. R131]|uniref:Ribosome hibernation promoting factor n=1 Tax=Scrofimicrobium appendicitidis TaxID=3079930 RepID=A0AAU7V870_9ACTO
MDIIINGRNTDISPTFRELAEGKLEKVTLFYPRAQRVDVVVTRQKNPRLADTAERIELTVYGKGPVIRAEAEAADRYAAIDLAVGKLYERLRRLRDRVKDHRRHRNEPKLEVELDAAHGDSAETGEDLSNAENFHLRSAGDLQVGEAREEQLGDSPVVVRQKVHEAAPMSVDEALYQMELVGHPFFLFVDEDTKQPCVVYHRSGWTYGVIRLNTRVDL